MKRPQLPLICSLLGLFCVAPPPTWGFAPLDHTLVAASKRRWPTSPLRATVDTEEQTGAETTEKKDLVSDFCMATNEFFKGMSLILSLPAIYCGTTSLHIIGLPP